MALACSEDNGGHPLRHGRLPRCGDRGAAMTPSAP